MKKKVSVVILAAGNSSRMSCSKALLKFDSQRTFIEKILDTYLSVQTTKLIVVVNKNNKVEIDKIISKNTYNENVVLVENLFTDKGKFYSLQLGLQNIETDDCFIQNIDNPFISVQLLNNMMNELKTNDYIVPIHQNKVGHPVLINKKIKTAILQTNTDSSNLRFILKPYKRAEINCNDENILLNINSKEDYLNNFHYARNLSEIN